MRTAILGLVLVLAVCGAARADDDDDEYEDLQPATRTVRFRTDWFQPYYDTSLSQRFAAPQALGDPPARPVAPGKVGVISGPPSNVMDWLYVPSREVDRRPRVYDGLR